MPLRIVRIDSKHTGEAAGFHWASIFSSAFMMLGLGIAFLLLGDAIGLSVRNAVTPGVHGALRFWSWFYTAITLVFSYFAGSALGTRTSKIEGPAAGGLHGLVSWGLASSIATAIAVFVSPMVLAVFQGTATDSANWLSICIVGLGFFTAGVGGMIGKKTLEYRRMEEEGVVEERPATKTETVRKTEAA